MGWRGVGKVGCWGWVRWDGEEWVRWDVGGGWDGGTVRSG